MSLNIVYNAIPSLVPFHESKARVRIVRGPIGSGKTTAMIAELLRMSCEQAPDPRDGIRRTRMLVTRNTLPQLKQTCLASVMGFLKGLGQWKEQDKMVQFRFGDVESDWLFLPLDTPENIQRLLSLELTGAWASELRELPPQIVRDVLSRCSRYPSRMNGGPTRWGLIGESNSFRVDSPWYSLLEENLPKSWEYFSQPGARDPEADWLQHLDPDYYTEQIESNTPEWVDQYIDNHYGYSLDGQAVYRNSFIGSMHVSPRPLIPNSHFPLIIGMDFARCPAAVIMQMEGYGQVRVLAELYRENSGVEKFVVEDLLPLLYSPRFARMRFYAIGDPSGINRESIGEESVFDALKRLGIPAFPAMTNQIDARIRSVEKFLIQNRGLGGAGMLIDPSCKKLIEGFHGRYMFKLDKLGGLGDTGKPLKIRPWADVHDALQYGCLGTARAVTMRAAAQFNPPMRRPAPSAAAWT